MRKTILTLVLAGMVALAIGAVADDAAKKKESEKPKAQTISGEIVDTGCYLGHAARGEKHASCAAKCISAGMPMGLLTDKGDLYLLTPNHDTPDAYGELKDMAAQMVAVTGTVMERNGMKGIDVTMFKAVETKAETKKAESK